MSLPVRVLPLKSSVSTTWSENITKKVARDNIPKMLKSPDKRHCLLIRLGLVYD